LYETQHLKDSILDDLKFIFNFNLDSKNHAILILYGQPILNNIFQRQAHEALKQRIIINYTFSGVTKNEVFEYISSNLIIIRGSSYVGNFACFPHFRTGCHLASYDDLFYKIIDG
jgi:hypothetical protein